VENALTLFKRYFTGEELFGRLFNYHDLNNGQYTKFVNLEHFAHDSDVFNSALSKFTFEYNPRGSFFISDDNVSQCLQLDNDFDPLRYISAIDKENEVLRYIPSYFFDTEGKWCLYFDNDLDVFICWCHNEIAHIFNQVFFQENEIFYNEKNDNLFLEIAVNRLSFKRNFDFEKFKNAILINNPQLFPDAYSDPAKT